MKTILIPTEDHASMQAVLETAQLIAQRFGGYMEMPGSPRKTPTQLTARA